VVREVKVLVVSADALTSTALARLLSEGAGVSVTESVARGSVAIARACREIRASVVVIDAGGDATGVREVVDGLSAERESSGVVVVIGVDSPDVIGQMFSAGVSGVVTKDAEPDELHSAVREVSAGHVYASRTAMRLLLECLRPSSPRLAQHRHPDHQQLSNREREAVAWLSQGMTNQEIARSMFVSEATVKVHLSRVMSKWGVRDRVQLVIRALGGRLVGAGEEPIGGSPADRGTHRTARHP
jgi:DNA-binding NarL/FixJ family response regulator